MSQILFKISFSYVKLSSIFQLLLLATLIGIPKPAISDSLNLREQMKLIGESAKKTGRSYIFTRNAAEKLETQGADVLLNNTSIQHEFEGWFIVRDSSEDIKQLIKQIEANLSVWELLSKKAKIDENLVKYRLGGAEIGAVVESFHYYCTVPFSIRGDLKLKAYMYANKSVPAKSACRSFIILFSVYGLKIMENKKYSQ